MSFSKTVLLTYQESKKKVVIPHDKPGSDLDYLEITFRNLFHFEKQVRLFISFQRFDQDFGELVDLEQSDEINHKDKLNVVVSSTLVTPTSVSQL